MNWIKNHKSGSIQFIFLHNFGASVMKAEQNCRDDKKVEKVEKDNLKRDLTIAVKNILAFQTNADLKVYHEYDCFLDSFNRLKFVRLKCPMYLKF